MNIVITYKCKWHLTGNEKYVLSTCGEVINSETNKIICKTEQGGVVGYYLDRSFTPKTEMIFVKIPTKRQCPFGTKKY